MLIDVTFWSLALGMKYLQGVSAVRIGRFIFFIRKLLNIISLPFEHRCIKVFGVSV